jgi:hypothetical protein
VIELGGDHDSFDGEIVVGHHKPDDHLSGFYSVDFDDFSTGDAPKKPRKAITGIAMIRDCFLYIKF